MTRRIRIPIKIDFFIPLNLVLTSYKSGGGGTRTHETLSGHGFPSRYNGHYVTPPNLGVRC